MEFGKLDDISQVDFSIPADAFNHKKILGGKPAANLRFDIASPSWGIKQWVGKIYPKGTKATDFLYHYSRQFTSIEHNGTRYQIPTPENVRKWDEATPEGFKFCPKLPESITHLRRLKNCKSETDRYIDVMAGLGHKLATTIVQVHPQIAPKHLPDIINFFEPIAHLIPFTLELRHADWFKPHCPELAELTTYLHEKNISFIITDSAGRRDAMHMNLTNKEAFIRWIGHELAPTDYTRMDEWIGRLQGWVNDGLEQVWFFIHEPEKTLCPEACDYMIAAVNKRLGLALPRIKFLNNQPTLFS